MKPNLLTSSLLLFSAITLLTVSSCKKERPEPLPATQNSGSITVSEDGEIQFNDAKGSLATIRSIVSYTFGPQTIKTIYYSAMAAFYDQVPVTNMLDAGIVTINGDTLDNMMGMYSRSEQYNFITGGVNWDVTGNPANNISPFSYSVSVDTPYFNDWTAVSVIDQADPDGFTLTIPGGFYKTDTVILTLSSSADPEERISKLVAPNQPLHFTPDELQQISKGDVMIGVIAARFIPRVVNSKKYYFINEFQRSANTLLD